MHVKEISLCTQGKYVNSHFRGVSFGHDAVYDADVAVSGFQQSQYASCHWIMNGSRRSSAVAAGLSRAVMQTSTRQFSLADLQQRILYSV